MARLFSKQWWERHFLAFYDWLRDPAAWQARPTPKPPGSLEGLTGHKYGLLVTYRRNGEAVPSPVWFGVRDGRAYVRTGADSLKVRRIRNNPQVLFAPSNVRGKPVGPVIPCTVRLLPEEKKEWAERILIDTYGTGRKIYDRTVATAYGEAAYLEITAGPLGPQRAAEKTDSLTE